MITDFRALCAELVDDLELCDWPYKLKETIRADIERARAALAEPKPEGPTLDDIWELCEEHGFVLGIDGAHEDESAEVLLSIARAVLARWGNPAPQPPDNGEVADEVRYLVYELRDQADDLDPSLELFGLIHNAADLLQSLSPPQPVPVSERWPGPEDCTAEGRYWIWTKAGAIWRWQLVYLQSIDLRHGEQTHWLPAHALPLPDTND